ncbi:MAG: hypothetical protein EA339_05770 [Rhodobacteraceae bacterium]|nr:MAG: hypothetical protein EA339_05770 [Paracoccaceae bacterium]
MELGAWLIFRLEQFDENSNATYTLCKEFRDGVDTGCLCFRHNHLMGVILAWWFVLLFAGFYIIMVTVLVVALRSGARIATKDEGYAPQRTSIRKHSPKLQRSGTPLPSDG